MGTRNNLVERFCFFLAGAILFICGNVQAQTGFGLRAGASVDPDQFHFGVHYVSNPLISDLCFRPNLEVGIGSNVTSTAVNLEFAYRIAVPKSELSAYFGAGPALNIYRLGETARRSAHTDIGGGFNVLLGLEHRRGLFGEFKVGAIDSPEVKITVGFTFR